VTASLSFEPVGHVYRFGGRVVPSATQVLEPLQHLEGIPWDVLEAARELGTHVHLMCHYFDIGRLNFATLDANLLPYLRGWRAFLKATGFTVCESEVPRYNAKMGYAGTPDKLGTMRGSTWVLDIKSAASAHAFLGTVGPQTAAYQHLPHDAMPKKRCCVQLRADGTYQFFECKDPSDFALFTSALNIWKHLNKRKKAHVD